METPRVSVVVASWERPDALSRCLSGLSQLDYDGVEVIVVACEDGLVAAGAHEAGAEAKTVLVDEPNLSAARNLGIARATGEIVAFIDDDAVSEPSWLARLVAPFSDPTVLCAGGFVLGRNGISLQWGARTVGAEGVARALPLDGDAPVLLTAAPGRAIKTEGTNMALRRETLAEMGGFDPAFRFYHDETDLNLRLAEQGSVTALVPQALVHHGFAPSATRRADRVPRDLFEIGASQSVLMRKHLAPDAQDAARRAFRTGQRLRLLEHLQRGGLDPLDLQRLMRRLDAGLADGRERQLERLQPIPRAADGFRSYPTRPGARHRLIAGRTWQRAALEDEARAAVVSGETATVLRLSPTALYHRMRFHPDGWWEQIGGQFGKALRNEPRFRPLTAARRAKLEAARLSQTRALDRSADK
ncbi:glycosyltransferase family 2 protein [Litorisediminicola beolgyonensis]|uniref:Glycosyltransferase family 2 protein n=1 Tax=Litorisediminicola beolgyonensis TaxID=1173614 RepID=A0ABW3ZIR6_9RHOB